MAKFLSRRWRRQPAGAVSVDLGAPLARELCYLHGQPQRGLLRPDVDRFPGSATSRSLAFDDAKLMGSRSGLGVGKTSFTNETSLVSFGFNNLHDFYDPIRKGTLAVFFDDTVRNGPHTTPWNALTTSSMQDHYPWNDGNFYCGVFSNTRRAVAYDTSIIDKPHVLVITADEAANSWRVYQGGKLLTSDTLTWGMSTSPGLWPAGGYACLNTLAIAMWARALRPEEVAALSENFWQLYRPRSAVIYSLPAAGASFNPAWARNSNAIIQGVSR